MNAKSNTMKLLRTSVAVAPANDGPGLTKTWSSRDQARMWDRKRAAAEREGNWQSVATCAEQAAIFWELHARDVAQKGTAQLSKVRP